MIIHLLFFPQKKTQTGLKQKLEDIMLPREWPWIETLATTSVTPLNLEDHTDDLKREATLCVLFIVYLLSSLLSIIMLYLCFGCSLKL
jgi:hypothetical protein